MKLSACLAATAAVACLVPAAAFADASTTVSAGPFWDAIEGPLTQLAVLLVLGLITWVTTTVGAAFKKRTGIDIETGLLQQEALHRDALQTALTNAASSIVQKVGAQADLAKIDVRSPEMAAAVNMVAAAVPEAMAKFDLVPEDLAPKILAKLPQVAPAPAAAPTVVNVAPAVAPAK